MNRRVFWKKVNIKSELITNIYNSIVCVNKIIQYSFLVNKYNKNQLNLKINFNINCDFQIL